MEYYTNHYKERKPMDTVNIIISFFKNINLNPKLQTSIQSEAGTWSCGIDLFDNNNNLIQHANGKGITEEFSFASGYAELFERFCNRVPLECGDGFKNNLYNINYKLHGYYIDKNEKLTSFNSVINQDNFFKKYFNPMIKDKDIYDAASIYFNYCYDNFIDLPYINILDNSILYFNENLRFLTRGSGGMAAGNTIEEALNQGLSELYEHYVHGKYFTNEIQTYYALDLSLIQDNKLIKIINTIKEKGNDLFIYDFSYNFNMPVLMSLIVNHKKHIVSVNFGAFPVFEIALERILTELYQGYEKYEIQNNFITEPLRGKDIDIVEINNLTNITSAVSFNEKLFFNTKYNCEPNKNCFLFKNNKNYSNEEIFKYYQKLTQKLGYTIYYRNNSPVQDICAIFLYSPDLEHFPTREHIIQKMSKEDIINIYYLGYFREIFFNDWLNNKQINIEALTNSYHCLKNISNYGLNNINLLLHSENCLYPYEISFLNYIYDIIFVNNINIYNIYNSFSNSNIYSEQIIKILTLLRYVNTNKYSQQEIETILNKLHITFDTNYSDIYSNNILLIQNLFLNSMYDTYHSNNYFEYLQSLIYKEK